ncbi:MAG: FkbM family methyltransferase [Terriglobia bacterium]
MNSFLEGQFRKLRWALIHAGPRRDITVSTANGLLTVDSKDWLVGKYLYVRREHETAEMHKAVNLLRQGGFLGRSELLLNVGANLGMTCIGAIKLGYFKRAVAFEPEPNNYRLLRHNARQNGLQSQIACFQIALSSTEGTMEMELSEDNSGDHRLRSSAKPGFFREEKRRTVAVQVKTLDSVIACDARIQAERVDLVWIDIQGHEGHFFQGAQAFFSRTVPVVSEFWPYGMERAGTSPASFCAIAARLFTHFYVISDGVKRPISEVADLFDAYHKPRQACLIALVREL